MDAKLIIRKMVTMCIGDGMGAVGVFEAVGEL